MVLIFGASSTMGREFVELLLSCDIRVRFFSPEVSEHGSLDPRVEVYEGDIRCEHCLREAMEGVDRILFLAIGMKVSTDEQVISRAAKSSGIHHVRKLLLLNDELVDLVRVNFEIDKAR